MKDLKARKNVRHAPLAKQLEEDKTITPRKRVGKLSKEKDDVTEEEYVSNKLSKKILETARAQTEEDAAEVDDEEEEYDEDGMEDEGDWEDEDEEEEEKVVFKKPADRVVGKLIAIKQKPSKSKAAAKKAAGKVPVKGKAPVADMEDDEEDDEEEGHFKSFEELMAQSDTESVFSEAASETESQFNDDMDVNEEDERALAMFMNPLAPKRLLSDIIMEKLKSFEANEAQERQPKQAGQQKESELRPEIVQVYAKVGEILKRFSSGKLPKAFKVLPNLRNWETLLYVTRPDRWTAVVFKMATVLFSRSMSDKLVQRFYYVVLLPKIREEIEQNKKLSFHYYQAVKKAIWRPAAFFRGIVIPLCESGDCTLREAVTIGSVLKRVSIPPVHAGVAIYKLCQIPYYGATQHIILVLLNKKFSLPYKVIDAVYHYFMNFLQDDRSFPALWHQTLLVLVMRYKGDLTAEQKSGLEKLMKRHHSIHYTAEIRRELHSEKPRNAMDM